MQRVFRTAARILTITFFTILFLFPAPSHAQPTVELSRIEELEQSMEANLTWNLENALLLYYPENKFVVKANVELVPVKVPRELPKLPEALLNREVSHLPGLPFLPGANETQPSDAETNSSLAREVEKQRLALKRAWVNVLLDENFTDSDVRFIRRLVALTADLDPRRGDQVKVERMPFPLREIPVEEPARAEAPPAQPESLPPTDQKSTPSWLPWAALAGVILLFLLLFVWSIRKIVRALSDGLQPLQHLQTQRGESQPASADKTELVRRIEEEKQAEHLQKLKSEIIDAVVGTPVMAAKLLQTWIQHHGERGYEDAALLILATSRSLIDLLAPYLGPETAGHIQLKMDQISREQIDTHQEAVLERFERELRQYALRVQAKQEEEDALAFLYKMSDDQLLHLIKPLKKGIKAIVLAQLRPEKAAKILRTFDPETRRAVLAAMGNIQNIPADVYQHIARQLAGRAQELERMRFVKADGVEALVEVLDQLDEQTQIDTLQHLQTQDVELAKRVRSRFLTFDDLLEMPEDQLRDLAVQVDRELLAKSLTTVDEAAAEKIIQALPDQLAEMVRASLETLHDVPEAEVVQARKELLRTARDLFQKGEIKLKQE